MQLLKYKKNIISLFILSLIFFLNQSLYSQNQDEKKDTIKHSPKMASLLSTALPGLGQAYNKKYWKIPIIYAGMGTLIYLYNLNSTEYQRFYKAFKCLDDNDPNTISEFGDNIDKTQVESLKNYYRRNRDLTVIGFCAIYLLNIVDANVDANLFDYDVSDDLSISTGIFENNKTFYTGLSIKLKIH